MPDPTLATEAEVDVMCAGIVADAQSRQDAERRQPTRCYEDLFPACTIAGCDEAPGRSGLCRDHLAEQKRQLASA